jgi:DHA1 family multidrug resistance protein-like MFS transporter
MQPERRNIMILFFTLIVIMMGFGMIIPILPFYVESFGATGSELGLLMAIFATAQFFFAPVWGQFSDRYGRKPILLIGVFGNALSLLLFGLSTQLWMLFASRALAGMLSAATLPTAMAFIGDSTSEEERGGGMGMINAAMGIGVVIGPGVGGWLAAKSLPLPFFVASGVSVIAWILIFLFLPESLKEEHRSRDEGRVKGPRLNMMWQALFGPAAFLLILALLLSFGLTNFEAIIGLYALERYGYGPDEVGIIITIIGIVTAVIQLMVIGPLTKRWGEVRLIQASLLGSAIGFILMLQAASFPAVLFTVSLFIISNAMLRPGVTSLISKRAAGGMGVTMGLANSFMSLGRIIGPIWAGLVFDVNFDYPYMSGALIMLIAFLLSLLWLTPEPPGRPKPVSEHAASN